MSAHTHTLPTAETKLTDRRGGDEIDPRRVECPGCEKRGLARREVNRCHRCGEWFEVETEGEDE